MRIDVMTLFPDTVSSVMGDSIIGRAQNRGYITVECHNIRDYTKNKQKQVDDYPYGGGTGMIMQADPLYNCREHILGLAPGESHTIYMTPQGKPFTQDMAKRLAGLDRLIIVCGHYEGVDERFVEECVDEEISLGDFVLTGGEIPCMAVCDAVCRLVPGVLASEDSYTGESHWDGLLEYPHYSRPETWHGKKVPEVLLSGHHANIMEWRRRKSLERTLLKRPDMLERAKPEGKDEQRLEEIKKNLAELP